MTSPPPDDARPATDLDAQPAAHGHVVAHALRYTAAATVLFALGLAGGWAAAIGGWLDAPVATRAEKEAHLRQVASDPQAVFVHVLTNNLKGTVVLLLLGVVTAGIYAGFYQLLFGAGIGWVVGTHLVAGVPGATIAAFLVPHGVVEVPAFCLAAGVGLRAGVLFFRFLASGAAPHEVVVRQLLLTAAASLALIVVAAVLEGFLTPAIGLRALGA